MSKPYDHTEWLSKRTRKCPVRVGGGGGRCGATMHIANTREAGAGKAWPYFECKKDHGLTKGGSRLLSYQEAL